MNTTRQAPTTRKYPNRLPAWRELNQRCAVLTLHADDDDTDYQHLVMVLADDRSGRVKDVLSADAFCDSIGDFAHADGLTARTWLAWKGHRRVASITVTTTQR